MFMILVQSLPLYSPLSITEYSLSMARLHWSLGSPEPKELLILIESLVQLVKIYQDVSPSCSPVNLVYFVHFYYSLYL